MENLYILGGLIAFIVLLFFTGLILFKTQDLEAKFDIMNELLRQVLWRKDDNNNE